MSSGLEKGDLERFINNETVRIREALEAMGYPGVKVFYDINIRIIADIDIERLELPLDTAKPHVPPFAKSFVPDKAETATAIQTARNQSKKSRSRKEKPAPGRSSRC
jgi:cob(I)alamin adenosyltransferase